MSLAYIVCVFEVDLGIVVSISGRFFLHSFSHFVLALGLQWFYSVTTPASGSNAAILVTWQTISSTNDSIVTDYFCAVPVGNIQNVYLSMPNGLTGGYDGRRLTLVSYEECFIL